MADTKRACCGSVAPPNHPETTDNATILGRILASVESWEPFFKSMHDELVEAKIENATQEKRCNDYAEQYDQLSAQHNQLCKQYNELLEQNYQLWNYVRSNPFSYKGVGKLNVVPNIDDDCRDTGSCRPPTARRYPWGGWSDGMNDGELEPPSVEKRVSLS
jgi:hypothetical protein